ncbi:hypothetical protein JCM11641_004977 [Rhodosporidiobolus odoratus]
MPTRSSYGPSRTTPPPPRRATYKTTTTPSQPRYQSFSDLASSAPLASSTSQPSPASPYSHLGSDDPSPQPPAAAATVKDPPSTWQMVKMTLGIAGAQLAWTVEMAYGTPYLLSLGLSKQATSLVWMAGPLSGLVVQPIVGALSDSSPSRYRRRRYILLSTLLVLLSTLFLAYAQALAALLCSLSGVGDWDPGNGEREGTVAVGIAVLGFYGLDFGLNGLQGSLRALALDLTPPPLLSTANAWLARHTHLANILGYLLGYFNLSHSPILAPLGGGQFRKLALLSCASMTACVVVTCVSSVEDEREVREDEVERTVWEKVADVVREVGRSLRELPEPVKRVCYVQFFNWTAWFPFLFYSTTYISETLLLTSPSVPPSPALDTPGSPSDSSTRLGSLSLLYYALISLAAGSFLPYLTSLPRTYPSLPRRVGPFGRWVLSKLTLRNCWTMGLVWFAVAMMATFFVKGVGGAMVVVAACGVPWAITCWVPFALVMEAIRELDPPSPSEQDLHSQYPSHLRTSSPDAVDSSSPSTSPARNLRTPFRAQVNSLRQASFTLPGEFVGGSGGGGGGNPSSPSSSSFSTAAGGRPRQVSERSRLLPATLGPESTRGPGGKGEEAGREGGSGGTVLGIHNMSIVVPQFLIALLSSLIFRLTSSTPSPPTSPSHPSSLLLVSDSSASGSGSVVWVLRFGGLAALVGAVVSRRLEMGREEARERERVLYGWVAEVDPEEEGDQGDDESVEGGGGVERV